ncbi:MAG TPA: type II secretion system protein GspL, partial [Albitalea sp.]|nr:type II secretion system protein GspL [Albitalea sp.]
MSLLVIQIPPRQRLRSQDSGGSEADAARAGQEFVYAASPDGLFLQAEGQGPATLLPKADNIVAVVADTDIGWHRITLPKAPASRLRAALTGVLEEAVLEDIDVTHLAIAPGAVPGQPTWVAALNRPWLRAQLAVLEKAGVFVDRVVPSAWPDDPPSGHFAETGAANNGSAQGVTLTWSHPDGVATLRLHGGLARAVVPLPAPTGTRWSATPGAASAAEQWLGTTVNVMPPSQRLLQAARTLWNLRQFDLARRSRGIRALRDGMRRLLSPAWRPVRIGLAALVVVQIVGLNLWAWHQNAAIRDKRETMVKLLQTTFPQVRAVIDAPIQMRREVETMRAKAGKPNDTDFEPMLQAAAAAWPQTAPVDRLRYEPGKLNLAAANWTPPQIEEFRARLRPAGW